MPCRSLCMNRSKFLYEEFPKFTSREVAIDQIKEGTKRAYTCPFVRNF